MQGEGGANLAQEIKIVKIWNILLAITDRYLYNIKNVHGEAKMTSSTQNKAKN